MEKDNNQGAVEFELDFRYAEAGHKALESAEGSVGPGRCVVLCGSSGCGKSTLLRCINGLIPEFYEGELKGFCRLKGQDSAQLSIGERGRLASSVFQDPRSQFFTLNSSNELAFGMENFGFSHEEIVKRVDAAFESCGLQRLRDRNVFELSSGERQLTAILAALAVDTDIFLLDEPTANLDFAAIDRLSQLLKKLKAGGKTLLISEHRLYYLKDIADEFYLMEEGRIVRRMSRDEMLSLTNRELSELGLRTLELERISPRPLPETDKDGSLFQAEGISFKYEKRGREILKKLSLSARSGEVIGLTGANGCGKTSFGKLAAGLLKASGGVFSYEGRPLSQKELTEKSIFIMQEAEFQFFTNSVLNELSYGLPDTEENRSKIRELLKLSGLWKCRNQHPFSLSGGQMQKLVMLLACLSPKPIVILDEPTAGLDCRSLEVCAELIRQMQKEKLIFIISHDLELISMSCTRVLSIEGGRVSGEFSMESRADFERFRAYMEHELKKASPSAPPVVQKAGRSLDPRTKFLIFIFAMLAGIGTDQPLIICSFAALLAAFIYERNWVLLLSGAGAMGSMFLLYEIFPGAATAFLISFFPRIILIVFAAALLVQKKEAARSLAALRLLHVPEKIIMVFSVVFRFFPVLQKDLKLMNQSIKTRGFFPRFSDKLKAVPEYLEIMIVPMVFRVIRIAEALSASAETRGIALKCRRESYISLRLKAADIFMMCLTAALLAAGLII